MLGNLGVSEISIVYEKVNFAVDYTSARRKTILLGEKCDLCKK